MIGRIYEPHQINLPHSQIREWHLEGYIKLRFGHGRWWGDTVGDNTLLMKSIGRLSFKDVEYDDVLAKLSDYGFGLITEGDTCIE